MSNIWDGSFCKNIKQVKTVNFSRRWLSLRCFISSLLVLSWILMKTFPPETRIESHSLFRLSSQQWNAILLLQSDRFWDKKGFVFLSNPMLVRSTDISIFYFSMLQTNVFDWRTPPLFFCYHPANVLCQFSHSIFMFILRGGSRAAVTSKMERIAIIFNGWKPLTIILKRFILDVAAALDPPLRYLF